MKKIFFLLLLFSSILVNAQYTYQVVARNLTAPDNTTSANIIGSGAAFHNLTWNVSGTVSTCSVRVDGSADGITWGTGDIIGATTCTSNGNVLSTSHVVNYVRINLVTFTGTNPVFTANISGYITAPSGGGSGTVTSVTCGTNLTGGTFTTTGTCAVQASPAFTGTPTAPTAAAGTNTTQIATMAALQTAIQGVNPAVAVQAASATVLPNSPTYSNGVAGVGATLTTATTNTPLVVDGYTPVLNDRILVKDQTSSFQNGIYTVTQVSGVALAWILTRALDFNQPSDMNNTGAIPVINGTVNAITQWVISSIVTTVGTDAVTFTKFSNNPSSTPAATESHTASSSTALNFTTCITGTYDEYDIEVTNLVPATNAVSLNLQFSTDGGATYDTTSGHYGWSGWIVGAGGGSAVTGNNSTTAISITPALSQSNTASTGGITLSLRLHGPGNGVVNPRVEEFGSGFDGTNEASYFGGGRYIQTTAINAFRIILSSGNIASGIVRCYGMGK